LLIDGEVVAVASADASAAAGSREVKFGLWSQGVQLAVRRIAVETLPEAV
jgi:hypothetical protein